MAEPTIELLRNDYVVISLENQGRMARYRRLAKVFPNLLVAQEVYDEVLAACDRLGRRGKSLLIDSREAIGRNDPEFEALLVDFRRRLVTGFVCHMVLVQTAIGLLQAQRFDRSSIVKLVTDSEAEAVAYLLKLHASGGASG